MLQLFCSCLELADYFPYLAPALFDTGCFFPPLSLLHRGDRLSNSIKAFEFHRFGSSLNTSAKNDWSDGPTDEQILRSAVHWGQIEHLTVLARVLAPKDALEHQLRLFLYFGSHFIHAKQRFFAVNSLHCPCFSFHHWRVEPQDFLR